MMKKNRASKMLKIVSVVFVLVLATACDQIDKTVKLENETDIQTSIVSNDASNIHTVSVNGESFEAKVNYMINSKNGWKFINASTIELQLLVEELDGYSVKVGSVYADVAMISENLKYNGLRQDSLFIEYKELNDDGISVDKENTFSLPFVVESVNHNEVFLYVYNGTGYSDSKRATEEKLREHAKGAKLTVVWTLLVTDNSNGKTYMKVLSDSVGLKLAP